MGESQPIHAGERTGGQKKGRKGKIRLGRACKGCSYNPNIAEQNGGVKKKQVKGCGSVNRPTPGSQWPAEPATSGFLQGVNFAIFRGRFGGLGVKLGVVDAGFSRCRAILYGVTIGVAAIFEEFPASGRIGYSPGQKRHIWERKSPLFFLCIKEGYTPHQKLRRINKE